MARGFRPRPFFCPPTALRRAAGGRAGDNVRRMWSSRERRGDEVVRRRLLPPLSIAAGVVLALLAAELGLRVAHGVSPALRARLHTPTARTEFDRFGTTPELLAAGFFGYHPYGTTRGFRLNSRGFRTTEYAVDKPPGTFRVVVLGDSFTFDSSSVPYDWMWHQRMGHRLAERTPLDVEVLSLSAPSVGPRFELRLWELEGRRLDPDLVVLGFFVGNDFSDESGTPLVRSRLGRLARWSYLHRLAGNALALHRSPAAAPEPQPEPPPPPSPPGLGGTATPGYEALYDAASPTFDEARFLRIERARLRLLAAVPEDDFRPLCHDAARVVEHLARSVELAGATFVVLMIPDEAQVDAALRDRLFAPPASLDVERPQRCLGEWLERHRIAYLDLLPLLRREGASRRLYKPRDTHWNAAGNELAGRALAEFLTRRGLGPRPGPDRTGARP